MIRILLVVLMLPAPAAAQALPRADSLTWMTGAWESMTEGRLVSETWVGPRNGLAVAVNLTTIGERRSFEFLRIADTAEGFSYFAQPGGRPAVEFRLKEQGARRVVFENAAHDFPQRVLYWRDGDALMARIEGTVDGRPRHREWRLTRP